MSRQVESFRVDGPQRWCPRGGRCKSHLLHPLGKAPRGHGLCQKCQKVQTFCEFFNFFKTKDVDVKKQQHVFSKFGKLIVYKTHVNHFQYISLELIGIVDTLFKRSKALGHVGRIVATTFETIEILRCFGFSMIFLKNHLILPLVALGNSCIFQKTCFCTTLW